MTALAHAEIRKLLATRSWQALFAAPVLYPLLVVALAAGTPVQQGADFGAAAIARGGADVARVSALLLGILAVAGEYRHGTVVPAMLVAPRRWSLLSAKLVTQAAAGAGMGAASALVALAAGGAYLASQNADVDVLAGDAVLVTAGIVAVGAFYSIAGAALGAVVRNQTAAVTGALVWLLAVEEALPIILRDPGLRRWLPGGAASTLLHLGDAGAPGVWPAALLLVAVAAALATAALAVTVRADVD